MKGDRIFLLLIIGSLLKLLCLQHLNIQPLTITTPIPFLVFRESRNTIKLLVWFGLTTNTTTLHLFPVFFSCWNHTPFNSIQQSHLSLGSFQGNPFLTVFFSSLLVDNHIASPFLAQIVRHLFSRLYRMATLEEVFEQFKQLPDWERFPLPEVVYKQFNLKKPQPASVMECVTYSPPPHHSLNKNGKVEIRKPAEGGVREINEFLTLPVEVTMIEDTKDQTESDTEQDSEQRTSNPPKECNMTETQPVSDHPSQGPSCVVADTSPDVPCRDAECSPPSLQHQNESSSNDLSLQTQPSISSQVDPTS